MFTISASRAIVSAVGGKAALSWLANEDNKMQTIFILQVMFASVVCMTAALTFIEVRRLRKRLD